MHIDLVNPNGRVVGEVQEMVKKIDRHPTDGREALGYVQEGVGLAPGEETTLRNSGPCSVNLQSLSGARGVRRS